MHAEGSHIKASDAVAAYIQLHGDRVTLGQVAQGTGLTIEQVAAVLNDKVAVEFNDKGRHRRAIRSAIAHLNQLLIDAAFDDVQLILSVGTGPYKTGAENKTLRWWIELHDA